VQNLVMRGPADSPTTGGVSVAAHGDWIGISARGELDIATAPHLDAVLCDVEARDRRVAVDLHALTFMDSSGVNLLARHTARAHSIGFALAIIPPVASVARVLDLAGVTHLLPIVEGRAHLPLGDAPW
jgi:stage II sporulation protein AA (anti-sigma F factor antagonist)